MTAELTLLLAIYVMVLMGVFMEPSGGIEKKGFFYTFQETVPALSARIEDYTVTGRGFAEKVEQNSGGRGAWK